MWKLIFSVPVLLMVLLVALLTMVASPRDAKKALSRKKEVIEPSESPEAREDSEAQRDLDFLARHAEKAPAHFDRAYVREGKPRWDTVGCNKPHFSREEILKRREELIDGTARSA